VNADGSRQLGVIHFLLIAFSLICQPAYGVPPDCSGLNHMISESAHERVVAKNEKRDRIGSLLSSGLFHMLLMGIIASRFVTVPEGQGAGEEPIVIDSIFFEENTDASEPEVASVTLTSPEEVVVEKVEEPDQNELSPEDSQMVEENIAEESNLQSENTVLSTPASKEFKTVEGTPVPPTQAPKDVEQASDIEPNAEDPEMTPFTPPPSFIFVAQQAQAHPPESRPEEPIPQTEHADGKDSKTIGTEKNSKAIIDFFGVNLEGYGRIAFVIDLSNSMNWDGALVELKAELCRAIDALPAHCKFDVVTFNDSSDQWQRKSGKLATATDTAKKLAKIYVNNRIAEGHTRIDLGVLRASRLRPDALILLTDGDPETKEWENKLWSAIKQVPRKTDIHTIGFRNIGKEQFLIDIARSHGGTFKRTGNGELKR